MPLGTKMNQKGLFFFFSILIKEATRSQNHKTLVSCRPKSTTPRPFSPEFPWSWFWVGGDPLPNSWSRECPAAAEVAAAGGSHRQLWLSRWPRAQWQGGCLASPSPHTIPAPSPEATLLYQHILQWVSSNLPHRPALLHPSPVGPALSVDLESPLKRTEFSGGNLPLRELRLRTRFPGALEGQDRQQAS